MFSRVLIYAMYGILKCKRRDFQTKGVSCLSQHAIFSHEHYFINGRLDVEGIFRNITYYYYIEVRIYNIFYLVLFIKGDVILANHASGVAIKILYICCLKSGVEKLHNRSK